MKPFVILILTASLTFAATRYVSNEGSDTVPYTSWETASSDLQKVVDYCEPWDTVLIAKGDYFGTFDVLKNLVIIGENRDSTRIYYSDSSGINQDRALIYGTDSLVIKNISLYGAAECNYGVSMYKEFSPEINLILEDSEIKHCLECVDVYEGSLVLRRNNLWNVRNNVLLAVFVTNNFPNYHTAVVENNVFYLKALAMQSGVNRTLFKNNIILAESQNATGISFLWSRDYAEITNNVFQTPGSNSVSIENMDTVLISNNTFVPFWEYSMYLFACEGIYIHNSQISKVFNNLFYQVKLCIRKSGSSNPIAAYNNLFYGTTFNHISGNVSLLEGNIFKLILCSGMTASGINLPGMYNFNMPLPRLMPVYRNYLMLTAQEVIWVLLGVLLVSHINMLICPQKL